VEVKGTREREREERNEERIGMAALRSRMAMLGRRSCGPSVASMGGKGMEIHQVFRPAPPPLRPAAVRNLEVIFAYLGSLTA